jgi:DNA-binding transcriptional MerR regulator
MGHYSIKELEQLSGVKAHTIRIWEKRYNVFNPNRTETNIRYYSDQDLKKLLNISLLARHGHKISKISHLSYDELNRQIASLEDNFQDIEAYIEQLTVCMIEMDEVKFEKLLSIYVLKFGFEKTIVEIVYPFLRKVGLLWLSDNINPIQEHFMSHLIRQKIIVAIDGLSIRADPAAPKIMLFLPEHELHEISLLFFHYLTRKMGFNTFYLGQHVPLRSLEEAAQVYHPDILITNISYSSDNEFIKGFMEALSKKFPSCGIYMTGYPVCQYEEAIPSNIKIFRDAHELTNLLAKLL